MTKMALDAHFVEMGPERARAYDEDNNPHVLLSRCERPCSEQKIAQFRDHLREYGLGTHFGQHCT
jgi:hypothetical protein